MDTAERLFVLVAQKFPEQKDFAAAIGVSAKTVSTWRTGRNKSFVKYLPKISEVLDTTVEYILTGAEPPENEQAAAPKCSGLAEEFARIFDQLTPENQNAIIAEMLRRQRQEQ